MTSLYLLAGFTKCDFTGYGTGFGIILLVFLVFPISRLYYLRKSNHPMPSPGLIVGYVYFLIFVFFMFINSVIPRDKDQWLHDFYGLISGNFEFSLPIFILLFVFLVWKIKQIKPTKLIMLETILSAIFIAFFTLYAIYLIVDDYQTARSYECRRLN